VESRSERLAELRAALSELDACVVKFCAGRAGRGVVVAASPQKRGRGRLRAVPRGAVPRAVPEAVPDGTDVARPTIVQRILRRPIRALLAWWHRPRT